MVALAEGLLAFLFFAGFSVASLREKEFRPAMLSMLLALVLVPPFLYGFLSSPGFHRWLFIGLNVFFMGPVLLFLVPVRGPASRRMQVPSERYDERDTMFSRAELRAGTGRFEDYYRRHPDKREGDDRFRKRPGLLGEGSRYHDPVLFRTAESLFEKTRELHSRVDGPPASDRAPVDADGVTGRIKSMLLGWGAHSAGICELRDYHLYATGGRADRYGKPYRPDHQFAIAFTVEMDYEMMAASPEAPTVVESARRYLDSGLMAVQLAEFIRSLGYPARAHIDGNYRVICPLVARDAGLGQIGRMGLLMTPRLGSRVRIAVVTTDLPMAADGPADDRGVTDFCRHCRKCAGVCPSRSIPFGSEAGEEGSKRWQIDQESCYAYWCLVGTDCGRCVFSCPYAHPDTFYHRLIRFGIQNSFTFRRLAIVLDDFFYGKRMVRTHGHTGR